MASLPSELQPIFSALVGQEEMRFHHITAAIRKHVSDKPDDIAEVVKVAAERERFALDLYADRHAEGNEWGTYFRPAAYQREDGKVWSSHDPAFITGEVIQYWQARSREPGHPTVRARYADAAWELALFVPDHPRNANDARAAIDAYIEEASLATAMFPVVDNLDRALNLSLAIRDTARTEQVVTALFDLHRRTGDVTKAGTCFRLYDSLYTQRKKLKLTNEQVEEIIGGSEACLSAWTGPNGGNTSPHRLLDAAERLAKYYAATGNNEAVMRVTKSACRASEEMSERAPAMVGSAWLRMVHAAYQQAGLKEAADRVLVRMKEKTKESMGQMISHVTSHTIPADKMEAVVAELTSGDVHAALLKIARTFVPKLGLLRKRVEEMGEKYLGLSLFPITLIDDDQPVAQIGSIQGDIDGHVVHEMATEMKFVGVFLANVLEEFFERFDLAPEAFVDLLYHSPVFAPERYQLLKNGVRHYRERDYIAAVHVLVPQIEQALRVLLASFERPTNMHNPKLNAYQERDLGGILADPALQTFLGENVIKYLRTLLTDQRVGTHVIDYATGCTSPRVSRGNWLIGSSTC